MRIRERACNTCGELDLSLIATEPFAGLEATIAGIRQLFILTPGVPPRYDQLLRKVKTANAVGLGAGSRGIIAPGKVLLGNYEPQFSAWLCRRGEQRWLPAR